MSGPRIGILGPYSSRNFGDTAIQMAVVSQLRRRLPDAELVAICPEPEDGAATHGMAALSLYGESLVACEPGAAMVQPRPLHWRLEPWARSARIARLARTLDGLVISGSGQLDDFWGGPWGQPWRLLLWSAVTRSRGRPVAQFGIGVDDLKSWLGRQLAFAAVRLAGFRCYRDAGTIAQLRSAGVGGALHAIPDPAFSLPEAWLARPGRPPGVRRVMVCPIAAKAWLGADESGHAAYLARLEEVCRGLLAAGAEVTISYSQSTMDAPLARELQARLGRGAGGRVALAEPGGVRDYLALAAGMDLVVASRLHALILAAATGTPVLALGYARKVASMMDDLGMGRFHHPVLGFKVADVLADASAILAGEGAVNESLVATLASMRRTLDTAYDGLAAALRAG